MVTSIATLLGHLQKKQEENHQLLAYKGGVKRTLLSKTEKQSVSQFADFCGIPEPKGRSAVGWQRHVKVSTA